MASGGLGSLTVDLLVEVAQWVTGLNKAEHEAQKFADSVNKKLNGISNEFASMAKKAAFGLAAGFSAEKIFEALNAATEFADKLDELGQRTGTSVEALAELSVYAELSGTNIDAAAASLAKFNKAVVSAQAGGTSQAASIFKELGVAITEADGKTKRSAEEINRDVMMALGNMEDGAIKTATAMALYGKSGAELIPVFNSMARSSDALKASTEAYKKEVAALAPLSGALEEQMKQFSVNSKTTSTILAGQLLPYVTELFKQFNGLTSAGSGLNVVVETLLNAFKGIVIVIDTVVSGVILLVRALAAGHTAINQFLSGQWEDAKKTVTEFISGTSGQWDAYKKRIGALVDPTNAATEATKNLSKASNNLGKIVAQNKDALEIVPPNALKSITAGSDALDRITRKLREYDAAQQKLRDDERKADKAFYDIAEAAELAAAQVGRTREEAELTAIAMKLLEKSMDARRIEEFAEQLLRVQKALADRKAAEEYIGFLNEIDRTWRDAFGKLFEDTKGGWRGMLESLKSSFKKMLVDYLYTAFAKPIVLNFVGSITGKGVPSSVMSGGGSNPFAQLFGGGGLGDAFGSIADWLGFDPTSFFGGGPELLNTFGPHAAGGGFFSGWGPSNMPGGGLGVMGAGLAGGAIGGWGAGAMGAGRRGVAAGQTYGSTLATIGAMTPLGPLGAAIGAGLGAVIGKFTDPDPDAMRAAVFGGTAGATGLTSWTGKSALGSFGFSQGEWLSDSDMGEGMKAFIDGITKMDDALAGFMSPEQIARVTKRLEESGKRYELGMEHGGIAGLGDITKDRLAIITSEINAGLGAFVAAFTGNVEDVIAITDAYLQLSTATDFDPEKIVESLKPKSMMESYQEGIGSLNDYIATMDTSAESLGGLVGQMQGFQAATVQMIQAIDAAAAAIHGMFQDTAGQIAKDVMTPEERYKYLQAEADSLYAQLQTETDPAKIQELSARINKDINEAWSLLDDTGKKTLAQQYIEQINMVDTTVGEKLKALKDVVTTDAKGIMEDIAARLDALFNKADTTADTNEAAANTMAGAAATIAATLQHAAVNGG